ncbi:histidine phosphatase family protein [Phaeobacter italicus]|uniref:histidine phosphatase family protein n=1 Tax=Phaeobacter italicus TaxID=481446 RepID=UPI001C95176E|nr:histidine phosphatase family protein [Phaeobacter italicus]MBY5977886.1 histidine phosphatase family protein [Phaeobacter italicus]MEC8014779.1 histidine phosphatase family protein [Pseudomonadota bacterium]
MTHITLVRHGQANTGARDETSYDRLSDLGHQQAHWLGEHLRDTGAFYPRAYCGTLRRHLETAQAMGLTDVVQDPRLNEMEYFNLAAAMETQHGLPIPVEREGFVAHMPKVFAAWEADKIANPPESWRDFANRTQSALEEIAAGEGPAIVVTSGGLIAMAMRQTMGLDTGGTARMALAIMNSSLHRLHPMGGQLSPVLFNAVPHLEHPDRQFAQTHL